MHGIGAAVQTLSVHICPLGQSAFVTQSTQKPAAMSQTCPGHIRLVVHDVTTTHAFARQIWPAPRQSPTTTHSTQRDEAMSQTRPAVLHSRDDMHDEGATGALEHAGASEADRTQSATHAVRTMFERPLAIGPPRSIPPPSAAIVSPVALAVNAVREPTTFRNRARLR